MNHERGWLPIEQAPKDGTEIFIFHKDWDYAPKAKWGDYPGNPVLNDKGEDVYMAGWLFGEWFSPGLEDGFLGWNEDIMPTHFCYGHEES